MEVSIYIAQEKEVYIHVAYGMANSLCDTHVLAQSLTYIMCVEYSSPFPDIHNYGVNIHHMIMRT